MGFYTAHVIVTVDLGMIVAACFYVGHASGSYSTLKRRADFVDEQWA